MKIFVLEVIMGSPENLSVETIGVYSTTKRALRALNKLPFETDELVYNVETFDMNSEPKDIFKDTYEDVKKLMDTGIIDQLVGEDGKFYYVLTDTGKEMAKILNIKKKKDL